VAWLPERPNTRGAVLMPFLLGASVRFLCVFNRPCWHVATPLSSDLCDEVGVRMRSSSPTLHNSFDNAWDTRV
jgi:hypothetical protein